MEIVPTTSRGPVAPGPFAARAWQLQQVLLAEVLGPLDADRLRLRIGGEVLTATGAGRHAGGQQLLLRVVALAPRIVLEVVRPPVLGAPAQAQALAAALAQVLPRQTGAREVQQILSATVARSARASAAGALPSLAGAVPAALRTLIQNLPDAAEVCTPTGLARAVANARQPVEAQLLHDADAAAQAGVRGDLRVALTRVIDATAAAERPPLPQAPTHQARDPGRPSAARAPLPAASSEVVAPEPEPDSVSRFALDGARARHTVQHLANLAQQLPGGTPAAFAVELPLRHAECCDLLRFDYTPEPEPPRPASAEPRASVRLVLLLDDGRAISAHIGLAGTATSIRLGADDPMLRDALGSDLDVLRTRCEAQGLHLRELVVGGGADVSAEIRPRAGPRALVDVRA